MNGWLKTVLHGLAPGLCIMCGAYSHRNIDLCVACEQDLPRLRHVCARCGNTRPTTLDDGAPNTPSTNAPSTCPHCVAIQPNWTALFAGFHYDPPVDRLISMFKAEGRLSHGKVLSELLARYWLAESPVLPDMILPVPLHKSRLRQRGFNQALEIAYVLSDHTGIPCQARYCRRVRDTPPQKQLPRKERLKNLVNAFSVEPLTDSPHVILVDDVVTTGATARALTQCLLDAGARQVDVVAIALRSRQPQ
ncbi:MAG: ComF family protein [Pseudomonadota bacterium]